MSKLNVYHSIIIYFNYNPRVYKDFSLIYIVMLKFIIMMIFISSYLIGTELPILIKKIRANIAKSVRLEQIESLEFYGHYKNVNNGFGTIQVSFKKPYLQRIETSDLNKRTILLAGYDVGFAHTKNLETNEQNSTIMSLEFYNSLRVNSIENLFFYHPPPSEKVMVQLGGELDWDGVKAVKITFKYSNNLTYIRYVDSKTGKILATIMPDGNKVVEEGNYIVEEIRFPKKIHTFNEKDELISTITFEKININPKFNDEHFRYLSSQ